LAIVYTHAHIHTHTYTHTHAHTHKEGEREGIIPEIFHIFQIVKADYEPIPDNLYSEKVISTVKWYVANVGLISYYTWPVFILIIIIIIITTTTTTIIIKCVTCVVLYIILTSVLKRSALKQFKLREIYLLFKILIIIYVIVNSIEDKKLH